MYQLRDYQQQTVQAVLHYFRAHAEPAVVVLVSAAPAMVATAPAAEARAEVERRREQATMRMAPEPAPAPTGWANDAAAGALAYAAVQLLGVMRRLASGETISWIAYPFLAMLMAIVAMFGGMYARRVVRRYAPDSSGPAGEDR